jgi:hypothetical protein
MRLESWIIPVVAIAAWAAIVIYRMHVAGRMREQAHRERLAMIEKGLIPPPETDSKRLDAMMDWHPSTVLGGSHAAQSRRTGIILIGVGIGLSLMLYVLGTGRVSGAGALLVVLGIAFLVNAIFETRSERRDAK